MTYSQPSYQNRTWILHRSSPVESAINAPWTICCKHDNSIVLQTLPGFETFISKPLVTIYTSVIGWQTCSLSAAFHIYDLPHCASIATHCKVGELNGKLFVRVWYFFYLFCFINNVFQNMPLLNDLMWVFDAITRKEEYLCLKVWAIWLKWSHHRLIFLKIGPLLSRPRISIPSFAI